ncbi:hypothetical protein SFRURICE_002550 [Spodoptera frugiperda]|nr:hypothetical protein SFRURICE_002550 [Spodoptera frugiperda]
MDYTKNISVRESNPLHVTRQSVAQPKYLLSRYLISYRHKFEGFSEKPKYCIMSCASYSVREWQEHELLTCWSSQTIRLKGRNYKSFGVLYYDMICLFRFFEKFSEVARSLELCVIYGNRLYPYVLGLNIKQMKRRKHLKSAIV